MEAPSKTNSIARTVENSISSFLRFGLKYFKTIGIIFLKPHKLPFIYRREAIHDFPNFVYPLTFLTFSYFFVAILISFYFTVTAGGGDRMYFDVVFITTEVIQAFAAEINRSPSIIKVVLTALPGIATIYFLSALFSFVFKRPYRDAFVYSIFYSYGLQCFIVFALIVSIFFERERIFYFDRWNNSTSNIAISWGLFFYSFIHTLIVFLVSLRFFFKRKLRKFLVLSVIALCLVVFIPFVYFWASASVSIVEGAMYPKQEKLADLKVERINKFASNEAGGTIIQLNMELTNNSEQTIFIDSADIWLKINKYKGDTVTCKSINVDDFSWQQLKIFSDKNESFAVIAMPPHSKTYWQVKGKLPRFTLEWGEGGATSLYYCTEIRLPGYDEQDKSYFVKIGKQFN